MCLGNALNASGRLGLRAVFHALLVRRSAHLLDRLRGDRLERGEDANGPEGARVLESLRDARVLHDHVEDPGADVRGLDEVRGIVAHCRRDVVGVGPGGLGVVVHLFGGDAGLDLFGPGLEAGLPLLLNRPELLRLGGALLELFAGDVAEVGLLAREVRLRQLLFVAFQLAEPPLEGRVLLRLDPGAVRGRPFGAAFLAALLLLGFPRLFRLGLFGLGVCLLFGLLLGLGLLFGLLGLGGLRSRSHVRGEFRGGRLGGGKNRGNAAGFRGGGGLLLFLLFHCAAPSTGL